MLRRPVNAVSVHSEFITEKWSLAKYTDYHLLQVSQNVGNTVRKAQIG